MNRLILIAITCLAGCSQEMAIMPIPDQLAQHPGNVQFLTSVDKRDVKELQIHYFNKYRPLDLHDLSSRIKQNPNNPELYYVELPSLAGGEYRVLATMVYYWRIGETKVLRFTRKAHGDFRVYPPPAKECFTFDEQQRLEGWQTTPVFLLGREQPYSKPSCHGIFHANHNWPFPIHETTQGGSLFIPISNQCFPGSSSNVSHTDYWQFTLSSPDLTQRAGWQNLKGVVLRLATKSSVIEVAPQIIYRQQGMTLSSPVPQTRYMAYIGQWRHIEHPIELPANAQIKQLQLHLYGIPEQTVSDKVDSILIDAICPLR